ncbi:MAG: CHAT domain-containing protein [Anaerolineae bacterium]|nr:CHAT domain-containing protein [Anaerolineae bacterium]
MALRTYHDFVIFAYNVEKDDHGQIQRFTIRVLNSPVGEGEREEVIEVPDYDQLKQLARSLGQRGMDENEAEQMKLGERLAELLLPEHAREMYRRSLDWVKGSEDEGLRVRLRLPRELSDLPWEYMYVQSTRGERTASNFLVLNPRISLARYEELEIPTAWFAPGERRRVLVVMATPEPFANYPLLENLPTEQYLIKQALAAAAGVDATYVPDFGQEIGDGPIPGAQLREVSAALREGADIFHFSGHGEFAKGLGPGGAIVGSGSIILADEHNQAVAVPSDRLLEIIREHKVRLVVLGACETAQRDVIYDWSSVAVSLLRGEIPAAIAMQFTVYDTLAARFMGEFYQALAGGSTIDEAVYLGRQAIRTEILALRDKSPIKPYARDWGTPVLYLRTPSGYIFPPITDKTARQQAESRTDGHFQVHQATFRWMERSATAGRDELQRLEARREALGLQPTQTLLLLRSAVAADTPEEPWLDELRKAEGERLIRHLDDPLPPHPTGPEEALRVLGLDPKTLSERPERVGPVAWSAARHESSVTRRTAALALTVLHPAPIEGLDRLDSALDMIDSRQRRWQRRAELRGALADADPEIEKLNRAPAPSDPEVKSPKRKLSLPDRLGIWLWRVGRRVLRDRQHIVAQTMGGALGAGATLGFWRMLITLAGRRPTWPAYFFVHSYLGALLGLCMALGMSLAESTRLRRLGEKAQPGAVARQAALLGTLFWGVGHFIVALLNALDIGVRPWMPFTGLLVGVGLSLALYDQPRAGRRPGPGRWLLRLGVAGLAAALAQSFVFWVGGDYEAASFSFDANFYRQSYSRYDAIAQWMDRTPGWEQVVMTADTALASVVLALGMTLGLTAAPRWLAWWRKTVGGNDT